MTQYTNYKEKQEIIAGLIRNSEFRSLVTESIDKKLDLKFNEWLETLIEEKAKKFVFSREFIALLDINYVKVLKKREGVSI